VAREISRQALIRCALGTAAAGALAPPRPEVSGPPDWAVLEDATDGQVIMPSNRDYVTVKKLFNSRFDDSTPCRHYAEIERRRAEGGGVRR
jgi:hypothetical protein